MSKPQWVLRPYQLLTSTAYLPYARSHGLFRRVAHWTVARMTGAHIEEADYGGYVQHPDDYAASALPEWSRKEWWPARRADRASVAWATLDIELAYPSIRLSRLRSALVTMLNMPSSDEELKQLYGGYPRPIVKALANPQEVQRGVHLLMDALESVRIDPEAIPEKAWRPAHTLAELPPKKEDHGLPTGLAISGILLNVAMNQADRSVERFLRERRDGAMVRFADDIFVMAQSPHGLFDLIEAVWQGLAGDENARLATAATESNLHLNWSKIEPPAVRKIIFSFLREQGWSRCKQSERCLHIWPPSTAGQPVALGAWWHDRRRADSPAFTRMRDALKRCSVGPGEVGPFVTTLVARMSEIGRDTLVERFGQGARERLIRLHDLARFDIDDLQVRSDTRRTFAANRLVRAWLPAESARRDLVEIRESVAHVLRETPWKFSLWHAVVRTAARRPDALSSEDDRLAKDWLATQLGLVASVANDGLDSWLETWPEDTDTSEHHRDPAVRELYLSFHRGAFWHALAMALRSLWWHVDEASHPVAGYAGHSPDRWTVRAVQEGSHAHVRSWLGALDQWADVLYPADRTPDLTMWGWELDQLTAAALASVSRYDVAVAWRHADPPGSDVMVPAGPLWDGVPHIARVLERNGRVSPHSKEHDLALATLAQVWLAGQDHRLGGFLFPRARPSRISDAQNDPGGTAAAGISLGCSKSISAGLASALVHESEHAVQAFGSDGLALWEYQRARRILLGQPGGP